MRYPLMSMAFGAAIALGAVPAQAQQVIGVSAAVRNDVRNKKVGAPVPRPVQVKDRVALNDQLQTGAKSQLQVLLLDKSVFTVGANARLTVDRYVYDPNRGSRSLAATVAKGAFRFMSGKPDRGISSQIRTPVATIGIRGTILEGVVGESAMLIAERESAVGRGVHSDPDTASLIVLRGPGNATRGTALPGSITVTAGGRTVALERPMLAVYVPGPGRAPIGPFRISPGALMQIQALLYPSVADRLGLRGPADNLGDGQGGAYFPPPREGPDYPTYPPGRYPPGRYPPGAFPPGGPGTGAPGTGIPGFPTPNIPRVGPRPQGANAAPPGGNNNIQGTGGPTAKTALAPAPTPTPTPSPTPTPTPAGGNNNSAVNDNPPAGAAPPGKGKKGDPPPPPPR